MGGLEIMAEKGWLEVYCNEMKAKYNEEFLTVHLKFKERKPFKIFKNFLRDVSRGKTAILRIKGEI